VEGRVGLAKIHGCRPEAKIVPISGRIDGHVVAERMNAGATGFLPKASDHDVI
jgi:DNA-binding NarL/FixJ family response regulator